MPDNKALTLELYATVNNEGFRALRRFMADNFVWWVAGIGDLKDSIFEFDTIMGQHLMNGSLSVKVHDIMAEGDRVAVEGESYGVLKNGTVYNNLYHVKFFFKNGKITMVKEYHDTKHANDIWGPILNSGI